MKINRRVVLGEDILELCYRFAELSDKSYYANRGQECIDAITKQIALGKAGEFALFQYLHAMKRSVSPPDINIYGSEEKRFDADIKFKDKDGNVMTCSVKTSNRLLTQVNSVKNIETGFSVEVGSGFTWTFQDVDKIKQDFVFLISGAKETFDIKYLFEPNELKPLFCEPLKESLKSNKRCIYESMLK